MQNTLQLVALDLETTGLDPKTDTIIEIAAIKFSLVFDGEKIEIQNSEERNMLINPWIPLPDEVTMITGITQKMLEWRVQWKEIQEKVNEFIGKDSIILGHNVFFDTAMLETHGINLQNHQVVDTFELSEVLSQQSASLNLGFLADFYQIPKRGAEHRALTDTWITIDLFIKFLENIQNLPAIQQEIWEKLVLWENSPLSFLKNFYQKSENQTPLLEDFFEKQKIWEKNSGENSNQNNYSPEKDFKIFSIDSMEFDEKSENSEEKFLQQMIEKFGKLHIVTHNKKTLEILEKILAKKQISTTLRHEFYQFIAGTEIWTSAKNIQKIERKYFIFLIKMLFWLVETKTGRVNELKYYGNEFEWLENFRLQANECNYFLEEHEKNLENSEVILEVCTQNIQKNPNRKMILRDVMLLEGAIRKNFSSEVHFEKLIENIKNCKNPYQNELIEVLRIIEGIYISAPNRPTGENPFPPGKYGEIYFLHQKSVWSEGFKWLSMATKQLFEIEKKFQNHHQSKSRIENILARKIHDAIIEMMRFNIFENPNLGMILTIQNDATSIQFIEREITEKQQQFFKNTIGYGFSLHEENSQNFVREAFGSSKNIQIFDEKKSQITIFEEPKNSLKWEKILILTTSMKHIREIGNQISNQDFRLLMQGISGGKAKMKHYFLEENEKKSILIGLIDTWRDEHEILQYLDTVIIAKIPFDPPTDPYFLAKTNGMSNSFERYSKPIVLAKLNSLIANIRVLNKNAKILCTDARIETTEWGKFIKKNLF